MLCLSLHRENTRVPPSWPNVACNYSGTTGPSLIPLAAIFHGCQLEPWSLPPCLVVAARSATNKQHEATFVPAGPFTPSPFQSLLLSSPLCTGPSTTTTTPPRASITSFLDFIIWHDSSCVARNISSSEQPSGFVRPLLSLPQFLPLICSAQHF